MMINNKNKYNNNNNNNSNAHLSRYQYQVYHVPKDMIYPIPNWFLANYILLVVKCLLSFRIHSCPKSLTMVFSHDEATDYKLISMQSA
jgi:hypothetical protein